MSTKQTSLESFLRKKKRLSEETEMSSTSKKRGTFNRQYHESYLKYGFVGTVQWNMCKHIHLICSKNLNEINSTIQEERLPLDSHITDEEMIICEDRKVLEKEAHVDNLWATSTWTEISKEEFQKECMQLLNKTSPEQLTF
ncbi:hypothetical protein TNIN_208361 [Trichonephila inaurata madagascariensis]|uniref:Uncharacterized protein n=1 Tax=Trichonephila inaurata madagascariensis TaxID=2747483 RepID=A0A8X6YIP0_9ARAC|nr:hypothetical protein TNIN_208361 [Trichonephila inaurata madagascariensis]